MSDLATQLRTNTALFEREFETITHNLANAATTGFKRQHNSFVAALQAQGAAASGQSPEGGDPLTLRLGVDFRQGKLMHTGRALDLALSGPGFFVVESPAGPLYTRNGTFHRDANNQLVDSDGRAVSGTGGPITLPPSLDLTTLHVAPDGSVKADGQLLGRLRVVEFGDQTPRLRSAGMATFTAPPEADPQVASNTGVQQGYQEASNVDTVRELVDMLSVARLYEANMRFISARRDASQAVMQVAMG